MTLAQFSRQNWLAQVATIKQEGSLLFIRQEPGLDIVLYQVAGFYAEVFFDASHQNTRIYCFDDTAALDVYLERINLSEIRDLL